MFVIVEDWDSKAHWTYAIGPFGTRKAAEEHMRRFKIKDGMIRHLVEP